LKKVASSQTNIIARILVVKYEEELRSVMELQLPVAVELPAGYNSAVWTSPE